MYRYKKELYEMLYDNISKQTRIILNLDNIADTRSPHKFFNKLQFQIVQKLL